MNDGGLGLQNHVMSLMARELFSITIKANLPIIVLNFFLKLSWWGVFQYFVLLAIDNSDYYLAI